MDGVALRLASAIPALAAVPDGDVPDAVVTKRGAVAPGVAVEMHRASYP